MPRCLMAKKWKSYPWTHQEITKDTEEEEEIIDVVGDSQGSCWGPSSPSEGATAPSPPPGSPNGTNILYNGYLAELPTSTFTSSCIQKTDHSVIQQTVPSPSYTTLNTVKTGNQSHQTYAPLIRKKPLSVTLTSSGAQLSLPPKKKDIYRPYCLEDKQLNEQHLQFLNGPPTIRVPAEEDLHAAHAILDLSASTTIFVPAPPLSPPHPTSEPQRSQSPTPPTTETGDLQVLEPNLSPPALKVPLNDITHEQDNIKPASPLTGKNATTVAYTYEAFFVSDGRSKKRSNPDEVPPVKVTKNKTKYTCSECGKQYATSSNLSRHKQTHRSLDSQAAKRCPTCGKAYVSMPALSMHILTHKLGYSCSTCGKQFSRPWLLQGHFRSHTGEKPYGCAHCGKAFADRSNLRAHMQTHSVDKNFECPKCHKTFALKSYLNKHLESACLKEENTVKQDNKKSFLSSSDSSII